MATGTRELHRRPPLRRGSGVLSAFLSALVSAAVIAGYFVLPFTSPFTTNTVALLSGGLLVVGSLLAFQVRAIKTSPYPRVRAVSTLTVTVPLFLVVFAAAYHLMSRTDASHFSEPLSRLDAMYFTVTTFATVGFGDISAGSAVARAVVTVQIVLDLALIGLMTRVIVRAVQEGLRRREGHSG